MKKVILVLGCAALAACAQQQKQAAVPNTPPQQTRQTPASLPAALQQALPPGHPATGQTTSATPAAAEDVRLITGRVAETMNSGGYTYVRLSTAAGDRWAAIRETAVKKGATLTIAVQMVAQDFESTTLHRKFDRIIFGAIADGQAPAAPSQTQPAPMAMASAMGGAMGSPAQHMKPAVDIGDVRVEKAPNGNTVAEVWAGKGAMQDKAVVIRGKVVKFLPEIMGKNWLHLRDGSGTRDKGDDDITVTTTDAARVGDVVTVSGTLRVDKDFGAGYRYPVIVEDAKLKKE